MEKTQKKLKTLDIIELSSAILYIVIGKLFEILGHKGFALISMGVVMMAFTILLLIFARQHIYWKTKPLLTVFSIYYKSLSYVVVIFAMMRFPGKEILWCVAMVSMIVYAILAYFNGKRAGQILNAYLYASLASLAVSAMFMNV
ncbi:hypothetical protein FACS1894178_9240 [Bacteroidia bacterium]|nr:hypothetical protein FACS1894178_9240 [Bacteroidia bacterium]